MLAGREVARALAKMSLTHDCCNADLSDCTEQELDKLARWENQFKRRYDIVGAVSHAPTHSFPNAIDQTASGFFYGECMLVPLCDSRHPSRYLDTKV